MSAYLVLQTKKKKNSLIVQFAKMNLLNLLQSYKLWNMLKDMEFAQNPEKHFHRKNYPTSESENWKTKLQVKFPKLELKPFNGSALNW